MLEAKKALKRIALVVPDLVEEGGVKTVAQFLVSAIQKSKQFDLKIISLATSAHDHSSIRLSAPQTWLKGIRTTNKKWADKPYTHVGAFFCEFEFQRYKPRTRLNELLADCDLVQIVTGSPAMGCAVASLGKPVVLQVATRAVVERRRKAAGERGLKAAWRRLMTRITDRFDAAAVRKADVVMVENRWMEHYCQEVSRGRGTRVVYAPPGVDTAVFRPGKVRFAAHDGSPYILTVGRLHDERKNVGLLLEAYAQARLGQAVFPKLVLAGATAPPDTFWQRVRDLELSAAVCYVGAPTREVLISLYQGATCFALSSDEEGFGMVLIEAMACGIPVVSTRCGGPDGIIEDGVDGYLVPMNDAETFATRLRILCVDHSLNRLYGNRAHQKIISQYDINVAGDRFISVYDELLSRNVNASLREFSSEGG